MFLKDERAKEFASGLLSAMISVSCTYPLTKTIYRQILEKSTIRNSLRSIKRDGIRYLFRGILPPLFQRSTEISVMFGVYKSAELALHPLKLSMYDEKVASSSISGLVESILTPFERSQILLMDVRYHGRFRNMGHVFFILIRDYGPKELFRGYTSIVVRDVVHNSFFFIAKDELNGLIRCHREVRIGIQNFLVGSSVGLMMTTLFYPLKVIKTNMQKQLGGRFKSIMETAMEIYKDKGRGIRNFYRGLGLNICRAMLAWGITNVSYEFIRTRI